MVRIPYESRAIHGPKQNRQKASHGQKNGARVVSRSGAHAGQLYAPSFGPVAHMAPIRFASPFIKTSYHHIFGPVTRLAVNRDRYMGP